jgi:hypothetical protein
MKRLSLPLALLLLMLAACQSGSDNHPVPTVAQIGGDIKCPAGDKGFSDTEAGWGFCWPNTWKYTERSQGNATQNRLDLTFDITDVPCVQGSPVAGSTPRPICSPGAGLFAFMIISTFERGNSTNLASWMQANLPGPPTLTQTAITWGNATEAGRLSDGRRIALTAHHVVILDLRSGVGQLDLESAMSARLDTWKFTY